MPLLTKNIEHTKFNTIIWLKIKKLPFFHFSSWISLENNNIKTAFLQVLPVSTGTCLNPEWRPNVMKNPKINVMIEEHIYHFLTELIIFIFPSNSPVAVSRIYWHSPSSRKKKNRTSCGVNQKWYSACVTLLLQFHYFRVAKINTNPMAPTPCGLVPPPLPPSHPLYNHFLWVIGNITVH